MTGELRIILVKLGMTKTFPAIPSRELMEDVCITFTHVQ